VRGSFLDSGCGTGYGTDYAARYLQTDVVGYDVSNEAVEHCKATYTRDNLRFEHVSDFPLPFADHTFDLVFSSNVIEHVQAYESYLSEVRRILKPDGPFLVATPVVTVSGESDHPYHCTNLTPEEWANILTSHFASIQGFSQKLHKQPVELVPLNQTALVRTIMASDVFLQFPHRVRKAIIEICIHNPFNITESDYIFDTCNLTLQDLSGSLGLTAVCSDSQSRLQEAVGKALNSLEEPIPIENPNLRRVWQAMKRKFIKEYGGHYGQQELDTPNAHWDLAAGYVAEFTIEPPDTPITSVGVRLSVGGDLNGARLTLNLLSGRNKRKRPIATLNRSLGEAWDGEYPVFHLPTGVFADRRKALTAQLSAADVPESGKLLLWRKYDVANGSYDPGVAPPPGTIDFRLTPQTANSKTAH